MVPARRTASARPERDAFIGLGSAMATRTLERLTAGLIDYAGLYPPASVSMREHASNYARALMGPRRAMLGRLICPASRLEELTEVARVMMPGTYGTSGYREMADTLEPWRVSVAADLPLEDSLEALHQFDLRHQGEQGGRARADSIELRVTSASEIDDALDIIPDDVMPYFEVPIQRDARGLVAALAGEGAAAKVRCGGITPDAIPSAEHLAAFILACSGAGVAFKATAGLHHPVRAEHPLSYAADAPRGVMHGFVNVFLAAALARCRGLDLAETVRVLEETDARVFVFTDSSASWRGHDVDLLEIAKVRETLALSYGSCSFDEPLHDLEALGWL